MEEVKETAIEDIVLTINETEKKLILAMIGESTFKGQVIDYVHALKQKLLNTGG